MTQVIGRSHKGEAHTIIIIVLVVALIAALGWIFWQNFIQKQDTANDTDNTTKVEETPKTDTPDNTPVESVLSLSNYGVEIPLGDVTTKYTAVYETYDGGDRYEIRTQIGNCGVVGTGVIVRAGKINETTPYKTNEMNGAWANRTWGEVAADSDYSDMFVVVGDEAYYYVHPQNVMCQGEEQTQEVAATKTVQNTLFKKLRAAK